MRVESKVRRVTYIQNWQNLNRRVLKISCSIFIVSATLSFSLKLYWRLNFYLSDEYATKIGCFEASRLHRAWFADDPLMRRIRISNYNARQNNVKAVSKQIESRSRYNVGSSHDLRYQNESCCRLKASLFMLSGLLTSVQLKIYI